MMLKNVNLFCPECLDCVNHLEKLIFFKNKISVLEIELQLKTKSQPAKITCFLSRKCSGNFSISECYFLNLKKRTGWLSFQNFRKRGVQIFPIKMDGLVKQVGLFFKKGGSITYFHANQPFPVLSFSDLSLSFYQYYLCFTRRTQCYSI